MLAVERVTKCTDELTLHMAIQRKQYLRDIPYASALFHPDDDLRTPAFTGAKHNRVLRNHLIPGSTTAVGVSFETEFAGAKPGPQHERCSTPDDRQGDQLLPIHGRNIN
mgnify:CR=1 FL=1